MDSSFKQNLLKGISVTALSLFAASIFAANSTINTAIPPAAQNNTLAMAKSPENPQQANQNQDVNQPVNSANQSEIDNPTASTNPATKSAAKQPHEKAQFCPQASELTKDGMWWSARGVWKSYSQSFAKGIAGFLGAQWLGIKVGKIVCLYSGTDSFDFPIALETEKTFLIVSPTGKNWSDIKKGYKMCKSSNVHDCPFFLKPPADVTNVYEEIKYKGKPGRSHSVDDDNFMYN